MYCENCGSYQEDNALFCSECGTPIKTQEEPKPEIKQEPKQKKRKEKTNKKSGKKKIIIGVVIAVIVLVLLLTAGIVACVISFFPLRATYNDELQDLTTHNCKYDNFQVEVKTNQPILSVKYVVDPDEVEGELVYLEGECEGSLFKKTLTIEELNIPPGESELVIYVKTLFGKDEHEIELESDIGYTSETEQKSYVELGSGTYLVSNELLVTFKESAKKKEIEALVEEYDGEIVGQLYVLNQYQIRFEGYGESFINGVKENLEEEDIVKSVCFNMATEVGVEIYPNDKEYDSWNVKTPSGNNWGLECIDAPGAWEYQDEMSVVRLGVIDSYLENGHSDLKIDKERCSVLATNDFPTLESMKEYYDNNDHRCFGMGCEFCSFKNHGTHVTGIIGALANNKSGVAGVNWNTELYFTTWWQNSQNSSGNLISTSSASGWMYSISKMVMSGSRAINVSVGAKYPTPVSQYEEGLVESYDSLIETLEKQGFDFLVVKAAGNSDDDASNYYLNRVMTGGEHSRAHTIIVGAVENAVAEQHRDESWKENNTKIYNMADYSNFGELIDVVAPGSDIYSTFTENSYDYMSGTSMAAPVVTGVVGLVYSMNPDLEYKNVKQIVCASGTLFCAKNSEMYPIVNAKKAVEWVHNNASKVPKLKEPTVGFITGLIQDAETMELIQGASVLLTNDETKETFESNVQNGTYYCYLKPGTYTMQFAAKDYITETVYNVKIAKDIVNYNVLLNLVPDKVENGTATGRLVDAFDAASIPNATMKVYAGVNNKNGTLVTQTTSDVAGNYSLTLQPGNYSIYASAEGYLPSVTTITIVAGQTRGEQNCTLTPILNEGEMRVILTWGQYPKDLDSHMVGPAPGGRFHTFYHNKNYYYNGMQYDNLDVDDITSYGPETTSVYVGLDGTYTFYVHNYTDRGSSTSSRMSTSGAQVKLYMAGMEEPLVFNVPNQPGTLWKVFSVNDGEVTPINTMSFHENPDTIGQ